MQGKALAAPVAAPPRPGPARTRAVLAAAAWLAITAAGFAALWVYGYGAGASDPARSPRWPGESALAPPGRRPVLILFLHPECPCSRATVAELDRALSRAPGALDARVLVVPPREGGGDSALLDAVRRVPGVLVLEDPGGAEAARFGARTSGTASVYDAGGVRRFFGGLTPARGHEGESVGTAALLALARGAPPAAAESPVYGCGLLDPGEGGPPAR